MLGRLVILSVLAGVLALSAAARAAYQQPRPGQPPPKPPEEETSPAMSVPPRYRYDSRGRRDPFVNPVPKPIKQEVIPPGPPPKGLPGVLISEAQIAGIVWSRESELNRAVIAAPGGKIYFAQRGDSLFDAVIKE